MGGLQVGPIIHHKRVVHFLIYSGGGIRARTRAGVLFWVTSELEPKLKMDPHAGPIHKICNLGTSGFRGPISSLGTLHERPSVPGIQWSFFFLPIFKFE